ncbi:FAD-dependent oxidoreductase [Shinella sp.]|uniref:FAD-dependent oxidoreductase n=1 Tax=Shinella sp. TaxID=1870904 RepID=UPI0040357D74
MPKRVRSINFCLPIYADNPFSPWQLDAAFAALRLTSPRGEPLDYRRYSPTDKNKVPLLPWLRNREQLRSVAVFREYLFDWPERIALDALFDAQRMAAIVLTYTATTALTCCYDGRLHLRLHPTVGTSHSTSLTDVTATVVLNLAGAWVDKVPVITGANPKRKCMGLKGVHIALKLPDEFSDWGIFTFNSIVEPLYCLPFRGVHYVGLTRTPFEGEIDTVSATDHEIDWMISEINRCLPTAGRNSPRRTLYLGRDKPLNS